MTVRDLMAELVRKDQNMVVWIENMNDTVRPLVRVSAQPVGEDLAASELAVVLA